jgi:hypothetical protein
MWTGAAVMINDVVTAVRNAVDAVNDRSIAGRATELLHSSFIRHDLALLLSDSHGPGAAADFVSMIIAAMPGWAWPPAGLGLEKPGRAAEGNDVLLSPALWAPVARLRPPISAGTGRYWPGPPASMACVSDPAAATVAGPPGAWNQSGCDWLTPLADQAP